MCLTFTLTDSIFTVTLDPRQFLSGTFFSVAWNVIKGTGVYYYFMKFLDAKLIKLQCAYFVFSQTTNLNFTVKRSCSLCFEVFNQHSFHFPLDSSVLQQINVFYNEHRVIWYKCIDVSEEPAASIFPNDARCIYSGMFLCIYQTIQCHISE